MTGFLITVAFFTIVGLILDKMKTARGSSDEVLGVGVFVAIVFLVANPLLGVSFIVALILVVFLR